MAFILIIVFLVLCAAANAERARKERIKRAYEFQPPNIFGSRKFVSDRELRKGKLI